MNIEILSSKNINNFLSQSLIGERQSEQDFLEGVRAQLGSLIRRQSEGRLRTICESHFAVLGKGLRMKIVYGLSKALNVDLHRMGLARNWALALELLHNGTLIHDDLQDGDHTRRNQPAVWVRFGANDAINAGGFLLTIGPTAIDLGVESDLALRLALHNLYAQTASQLVNGQSLEFEMARGLHQPEQLEEIYWRCIRLKTSALFASAALGAAILAELEPSEAQLLGDVFTQMGILFQLQDDLVDLYGDKRRGQVACDLREGKVSCLVVNHFKLYPAEASDLATHLRKNRLDITDAEVNHWVTRFQSGGALELTLAQMDEQCLLMERAVALMERPPLTQIVTELQEKFLGPLRAIMTGNSPHA